MSVERIGGAGIEGLYMALMEAEQEQRKAHREIRHAAEDSQVEAMMESADHLEDAAAWQAVGTAIDGATQIASGALSITASVESLDASNAASATGAGAEGAAAAAERASGAWQSGTQIGVGLSKVATAGTQYLAGVESADAKRCDARAQGQQSLAADARDGEQQAREVSQTLLRKLDQVQDSQNAAMGALLRA